jgi:hypothetical protein
MMNKKMQIYLLTLGPRPVDIEFLLTSCEIIQTMQPCAQHVTQVLPHMLNYKKYQGQFENIIIMNMNNPIINHRKKLMEVDGRKTIMLERMTTSLTHPSLNSATRFVEISIQINVFLRFS